MTSKNTINHNNQQNTSLEDVWENYVKNNYKLIINNLKYIKIKI